MTDSAARVACYDQEMQRRHAAAPASATASVPAATPASGATPNAARRTAAKVAPDDTIGLDGKQLSLKRKEEGIQAPAVQPIATALAHLTARPGHQYQFELDNGQLWESTDAEPDLFFSPHEAVTIRPGVLGAFFLKTKEGLSIRIHRLR